MSTIVKKKTYFSNSWLHNQEYSPEILKNVIMMKVLFFCSWCCKNITLSNIGVKAIKNHMSRETHKKASKKSAEHQKHKFIFFYYSHPSSSSSTMVMPTTDDACAEIVWALTVAQNNFSANCCDGMSEIFKPMFSENKVHRHFSMGKSKCSYVLNFGFGSFFQKELVERV